MKAFINKHKKILRSIVIILAAMFFCYSVVKVFNSKNEETIDRINQDAKLRTERIEIKLDSARRASMFFEAKFNLLEGELKENNMKIDMLRIDNKNQYNKLIQIQRNEKDYIPTNASLSEQLEFLSNYRYSPIAD